LSLEKFTFATAYVITYHSTQSSPAQLKCIHKRIGLKVHSTNASGVVQAHEPQPQRKENGPSKEAYARKKKHHGKAISKRPMQELKHQAIRPQSLSFVVIVDACITSCISHPATYAFAFSVLWIDVGDKGDDVRKS
jgi:hypothetical protein